jgi:hypothetical protein
MMIKPRLEPTMDTDPANIPTLANNRLALPPSRKTRGRAGPLNPGALQTNQPATATHRLIKLSFFFNRRKRLAGATNVIGVVRVGKSGSNPREPGTGRSASVWKHRITFHGYLDHLAVAVSRTPMARDAVVPGRWEKIVAAERRSRHHDGPTTHFHVH